MRRSVAGQGQPTGAETVANACKLTATFIDSVTGVEPDKSDLGESPCACSHRSKMNVLHDQRQSLSATVFSSTRMRAMPVAPQKSGVPRVASGALAS